MKEELCFHNPYMSQNMADKCQRRILIHFCPNSQQELGLVKICQDSDEFQINKLLFRNYFITIIKVLSKGKTLSSIQITFLPIFPLTKVRRCLIHLCQGIYFHIVAFVKSPAGRKSKFAFSYSAKTFFFLLSIYCRLALQIRRVIS